MTRLGFILLLCICTSALNARASDIPARVPIPQIEGNWWQIAANPSDHKYATANQEPVDFALWQAADGSWQLLSCIRNTTAGGKAGKTRFFYRWEGKHLTDQNWKPMGIAMEADASLGETPGGLQAPHVVKLGPTYHMFYGDWVNICHATSTDGKTFARVIQKNGKTAMFSEGPDVNTRDAMLMRHADNWFVYYTAYPNRQGMVFVRTTKDLEQWSDSSVAAFGGRAGANAYSSECPHVIRFGPADFYLFRTQSYGAVIETQDGVKKRAPAKTSVYYSKDPTMFGINQDDKYFVSTLPLAAPEIILHRGRYYIAALNDGALDGIRVARLRWVRK